MCFVGSAGIRSFDLGCGSIIITASGEKELEESDRQEDTEEDAYQEPRHSPNATHKGQQGQN